MRLTVSIQYATQLGESLLLHISSPHDARSISMQYTDAQQWSTELVWDGGAFDYQFSVVDSSGKTLHTERHARSFSPQAYATREYVHLRAHWDLPNFPEHVLDNKIFHNRVFNIALQPFALEPQHTHVFQIRAPLYPSHWQICLLGAHHALGNWQADEFVPLQQVAMGIWRVAVDLSNIHDGVAYKYGIFDTQTEQFVAFEGGENRFCPADHSSALTVVHDAGYRFLPDQLWRAAGVAIPVFSLRSTRSLGSGEFSDLKLLGDWAHAVGLSLIQLLPINDSTVNYSWLDQYPYSAISVYALHPQYLSLLDLPYGLSDAQMAEFKQAQAQLNITAQVDFERMIRVKWKLIRSVFQTHHADIMQDADLMQFIAERAQWLKPYAVFCALRDQFGSVDYAQWGHYAHYTPSLIEAFFQPEHALFDELMLHCFVQYHLHLQLRAATQYLQRLGVSLKGDLPIGVRRHSVDTWIEPELFSMDFQAGAPPDLFSDLGQNWELPTYDWVQMKLEGYQWWSRRLAAMSQYFDALRIDHILGFFRIWRIPTDATQGLLGYFYPAQGVTREELEQRGIDFDETRDCAPFITDALLRSVFDEQTDVMIERYFHPSAHAPSEYVFQPAFDTQRKIEHDFDARNDADNPLKQSLLALHSNVLFIMELTENNIVYHPRFNVYQTTAYQNRSPEQQQKLRELYHYYFFVRQEALWRASGLEKLPALQRATDMLICAEDLGLVPDCVPQVLDELGIVALKLQRAPKEQLPYYDPKNLGYMNVTTTSSHDSSTLRQWWAETPTLIQQYYSEQLQRPGDAPSELTPALAEQILRQNLQSPAMLAIFPLQDWLAAAEHLPRMDVNAERINDPANPDQRWAYRMHITLEELLAAETFNRDIADWITLSNRRMV